MRALAGRRRRRSIGRRPPPPRLSMMMMMHRRRHRHYYHLRWATGWAKTARGRATMVRLGRRIAARSTTTCRKGFDCRPGPVEDWQMEGRQDCSSWFISAINTRCAWAGGTTEFSVPPGNVRTSPQNLTYGEITVLLYPTYAMFVVRDRRGARLPRKLIPCPRQAAPWHA
jgi:hypothetical protein